jgi:hypothetical protein
MQLLTCTVSCDSTGATGENAICVCLNLIVHSGGWSAIPRYTEYRSGDRMLTSSQSYEQQGTRPCFTVNLLEPGGI